MRIKYLMPYFIGALIGAATGFAYWKIIGCNNQCLIWSSWWRSSLAAGLIGAGFGSLANDLYQSIRKRSKV